MLIQTTDKLKVFPSMTSPMCELKKVQYIRVSFLKNILSPLVILGMEKTMVAKVISELKFVSRFKILFFQKLALLFDLVSNYE